MASDHERALQGAEGGAHWEAKAKANLPFGRLIDPDEAARGDYKGRASGSYGFEARRVT